MKDQTSPEEFGLLFKRFLDDLVNLAEGPVDWVNFHLDGDRVLPVVQFGLYLMKADGAPLVAFVSGPNENMGPTRARARVEVMAAERASAQRFLADITKLMGERNVYRGKIVSLGPQQFGFGPQTIITFHRLPAVARDDVILPSGILERIDRHAIAFSEHAERLIAAGRPIKRGLLHYGSPGTGKTLTVMYLAGRMQGRTVLLTTGRGLGFISAVAQMARILAPSMVVVEDVALIPQERGMPGMQTQPMLFELLNEMDGLRDDVDVLFVRTTNRPDILEPALAARPGRVDLAVPLPLPDADARRRLFALYGRGLRLHVATPDP